MKLPRKVPKQFWPYFWDVDVKKLDPSQKPYFVIQRLLDKGNDKCVRWVRHEFPEDIIKETFTRLYDFSPWIGNFWQLFLKIPKTKMLCLQEHYLQMRRTHWPY